MLLVTFVLLSLISSSSSASHLLADSSSRSLLFCLFPFFYSLVDLCLDLPFVARYVIIYCDFIPEGPLF
jgi:hypothetical protein